MSPSAYLSDAQIDCLRMLSCNDNKENDPISINILTNHEACLHDHKTPPNQSDQITELIVSVADNVGQLELCEKIRRLKIQFSTLDVIKSLK